jgi:ArsR family transcriptional regulator
MKSVEVVKALSALAQESRLAVFRLLVERGPEGFTPGVLSEKLQIPATTLSFHLKEPVPVLPRSIRPNEAADGLPH